MSANLPPLPEPYSASSAIKCATCGASYKPGYSLMPQGNGFPSLIRQTACQGCGGTSFTASIGYDSPSPAKYTAGQMRAYATKAVAAQAAELEALRRWKSTNAPRLDALQGLLTAAQHEAHSGREAVASLASEREANALLTDEVEALRAALAELVALAELKAAIEMWVLDTVTGKQWPKMQPYEARMAACDDYAKRKPLALAAARAALKEQTPPSQQKEPTE